MGHGLQVIEEIPVGNKDKWILIQANTTIYIPLSNASNWDSVYGAWFYLQVHTAGVGNVTVTLQGASDLQQATWVDIGAGVALTGGSAAAPVESSFNRTPVAVAAGTAINTLQPYLRLKMVTDVGAVAAIHRVARTIRGLV